MGLGFAEMQPFSLTVASRPGATSLIPRQLGMPAHVSRPLLGPGRERLEIQARHPSAVALRRRAHTRSMTDPHAAGAQARMFTSPRSMSSAFWSTET